MINFKLKSEYENDSIPRCTNTKNNEFQVAIITLVYIPACEKQRKCLKRL